MFSVLNRLPVWWFCFMLSKMLRLLGTRTASPSGTSFSIKTYSNISKRMFSVFIGKLNLTFNQIIKRWLNQRLIIWLNLIISWQCGRSERWSQHAREPLQKVFPPTNTPTLSHPKNSKQFLWHWQCQSKHVMFLKQTLNQKIKMQAGAGYGQVDGMPHDERALRPSPEVRFC